MRATRKSAASGELRIFHGRLPNDSQADTIFAWGDGCSKRDSALLHWVIGSKRPPSVPGRDWEPSLLDELASRGYDLSTIEFRIKKKAVTTP
jgi:hypothetical protein